MKSTPGLYHKGFFGSDCFSLANCSFIFNFKDKRIAVEKFKVQKPSENRTSQVFEWSKHVRLSNGLVFKRWFENRTKMSVMWSKTGGLKHPGFIWSA